MKDFKTLLNEVPSKKIVIGFGRFNPPTTGHELLINKVTQYARSKGSPAKIYVTATEDKKKNPLKQERKIYYMKRMFGQNTPLVPTKSPNQRTIIEVAKHLNTKEKITELTLIAGSDRIAEYKRLLNQYNGKDYNFDKITVLSSGRRDPDSDLAEGMSATKMRTAASSGKFTDFKRGVPRRMSIADSKRLFNEVRKGMGLPPIREEIVLPTSELREDYVAKKIFNIGAVVEDDKGVYEVMDRGANYISVSDEDGNVSKKWLHEVRQIAERNTVNDYHSNNELVYKGFTTENLHNYYEIKDKFLDLFETNKDPVAILSCLKLVDQSLKILEEGKSRGYALIEEAGADSIIKMKLADSLNSIGELENHDYLDQINADLADLLAREPNMKQEIKEQKNLKIDPQNKFRFTSADRIKVARIIAGSLGVDNPEKMSNPTQLINFGLRKLRTKRVTPEFAEIVKKMLQTANTAGIDYDRQYLPAIMRSGKFAVESKSFKDFMNEISGSGVDPIVVQLRKNINLKGNYTFEFTDGSKGKMSPGASEGILRKYESLRRPAQKLNVSKGMGKSMKSLKDTLSNWDSVANKEDPKDKKSGREEPTRGLVNPMDKKPVKKEELEEKKDPEKDYKPHMMYDPKTGKGIMAKKFADHEKLKKQGYTHDDPSTKQIEENKGVAEKAKKSGIPKGILMQVFRRGMAAYGTGHRPGASQQQWAFARVNSFIGKGKGTWGGADKDLAAKARKSMSKESLDEKGPGLYHNINMKRKRGEKMRKKGEKGAPSAKDFENAAKTAKEERELCHSKDHDCATVVEHIVWGFGKPVYESHAIPTDDGYVAWYDVEFEHGIEREVPTEDLKIYTTEAHGEKTLNKGKKKPASKSKAEPVKEMGYVTSEKYSDSEIKRAVEIAKKMAGNNYTGAHNAIEKMKKGLASVGKVKYALKKAAESFETWQGLSISEVNDVLVDIVSSAQDYIKLVEDGDLKSVDEPEVEIAKGMPLSFKQFQSKIGD